MRRGGIGDTGVFPREYQSRQAPTPPHPGPRKCYKLGKIGLLSLSHFENKTLLELDVDQHYQFNETLQINKYQFTILCNLKWQLLTVVEEPFGGGGGGFGGGGGGVLVVVVGLGKVGGFLLSAGCI